MIDCLPWWFTKCSFKHNKNTKQTPTMMRVPSCIRHEKSRISCVAKLLFSRLRFCYPSMKWEILRRPLGPHVRHLWIKFDSLSQLTASSQPHSCSWGCVRANICPSWTVEALKASTRPPSSPMIHILTCLIWWAYRFDLCIVTKRLMEHLKLIKSRFSLHFKLFFTPQLNTD